MLQENPIWNDEAYSKDVRRPDAYEEGERWQDKSNGAEERLSGCLHIQDLEIAQAAMSPTGI
ncbi:hypothetical protein ABIB99_008391 [Bradyrhizobium sp. LA6.1]|uniref:hypothetical protein n=1 Tax=Bradyrhizobium sp. LA6.1 TaxID=3156378 RepID=UPI0033918224